MRKYIFSTLLLLLSNIAEAEVYIHYVNGAVNSSESVRKASQEEFKKILEKNGIIDTVVNANVINNGILRPSSFVPIDNGIFSSNPILVRYQQSLSASAFKYSNTAFDSKDLTKYYIELANSYDEQMLGIANGTTPMLQQSALFFSYGYARQIGDLIKNGHKIIIVSHSQGNLYVEAAIALLKKDYKTLGLVDSSIRVVGLGNVAATTKDQRYITIAQDGIVFGVGGNPSVFFKPMSANYIGCYVICTTFQESTDALDSHASATSSHSAKEIYLNEKISVYKIGEKFPEDPSSPIIIVSYPITQVLYKMILQSWVELKHQIKKSITSVNIIQDPKKQKINKIARLLSSKNINLGEVMQSVFAYIGDNYSIRVDGTGFDGNEAVSINGSICPTNTIQRGNGYFIQQCVAGSIAGENKKIRIYDTTYNVDLDVPAAYQYMSLRGPVLAPLAPILANLGNGKVRVMWNTVGGATQYQVNMGDVTLATVNAPTISMESPHAAGSTLCYRVRAIANGVASEFSGESCITPSSQSCSGQWNSAQYNIGATEVNVQSCRAGYSGKKTFSHTCEANGVWGNTFVKEACSRIPTVLCLGSWGRSKYLVGKIESKTEACAGGQVGSITTSHTCQSDTTWTSSSISNTCTCPTGQIFQDGACKAPAEISCQGTWSNASYSVNETELKSDTCTGGQNGNIEQFHTCRSNGTWTLISTLNDCSCPSEQILQNGVCIIPVVYCEGAWSTARYTVNEVESRRDVCSGGQIGYMSTSHTCRSNSTWTPTSTASNCTCPNGKILQNGVCIIPPPTTCTGTWHPQSYSVGAVEDQYLNTCPPSTSGQVRHFHTCQAGGVWSATANSDNCTVSTIEPPTGINASSVNTGVQMTWTAVPGATRYYITRDSDTDYSYVPSTNYTDPNARDGAYYCYAIAAYSSYNNSKSVNSAPICVTYQRPVQDTVYPPSNVAASQYVYGTRKALRLSWSPAYNVDSYNIYRRDRSGIFAPVSGSDTSFIDWPEYSLTSGVSYCYFVRSVKNGVPSIESNEACAIAP